MGDLFYSGFEGERLFLRDEAAAWADFIQVQFLH